VSGSISASLRRLVVSRAAHLCEYCLIHEDDTFFGCEVDHIISRKHGGATQEDNLAYACLFCNRNKGSDISSRIPETGELIRFFNPRIERWSDHFQVKGAMIVPLTAVGTATARILRFNDEDRLLERDVLRNEGRYPPTAVQSRIGESR
jgi:hypothetical protein